MSTNEKTEQHGNSKARKSLHQMGRLLLVAFPILILLAGVIALVLLRDDLFWILTLSMLNIVLAIVLITGLLGLATFGTIYAVRALLAWKRQARVTFPKGPKIAAMAIVGIVLFGYFYFEPLISSDSDQYKKENRDQVTRIAGGDALGALRWADNYLARNATDLEAIFIQAMAYTQLNQLDNAMGSVKRALELGLPIGRFLAGPRSLFQALYEHQSFKELVAAYTAIVTELIHGPMLGNVTSTSASIWLRTRSEISIAVIYSTDAGLTGASTTSTITTSKDDDYTGIIQLSGLNPTTTYYYDVVVNGQRAFLSPIPTFTTYSTTGTGQKFEVGFGGGAGYTPWHEYMWSTLDTRDFEAFLFLGDNVYIDTPEVPETQQYCYYRRQSRLEYRNFTATTPIYAIWDDHDFGGNDCTSSLDVNDPPWKLDVLEVYKQNWNNPYYGGGTTNPGIWFDFTIGDVAFFMLDCRFYRQNPSQIDSPSMLGPTQKQWLKESLKACTATFKIIASSVPWASGTKPGSKDTWDGFPAEREEIFKFIEDNTVEGVVLLSADRHRSDAWEITRPDGYDFYDFMSSQLTNVHTHALMDGALFGYNAKNSFGMLSFDTTLADPTVTYSIVNIDNELMNSLTLARSDLSF